MQNIFGKFNINYKINLHFMIVFKIFAFFINIFLQITDVCERIDKILLIVNSKSKLKKKSLIYSNI